MLFHINAEKSESWQHEKSLSQAGITLAEAKAIMVAHVLESSTKLYITLAGYTRKKLTTGFGDDIEDSKDLEVLDAAQLQAKQISREPNAAILILGIQSRGKSTIMNMLIGTRLVTRIQPLSLDVSIQVEPLVPHVVDNLPQMKADLKRRINLANNELLKSARKEIKSRNL